MRLLKFVKIDFTRCKKNPLLFFFLLLAFGVMLWDDSSNALFGCLYCLFGGIIFSSTPFSMCSQTHSGFLKMLPAQEGDDIRGHFLFSFAILLLSMLFSLAAIQAVHIFRPAFSMLPVKQGLLLFSASILVTSLQNLVLCVFRTNSAQAMQLLRMAPAFLFYFGYLIMADYFPEFLRLFTGWFRLRNVCLLLLACLLLYCIIAQLSAVLTSRRDS